MGTVFTSEYLEKKEKLENWWDAYSLPFATSISSSGDEGYHNHTFFEIFYVTSGSIHHQIETQQDFLKQGAIFFIPPNIYHGFLRQANNECSHRDILIGPSFFRQICDGFSPDLYKSISMQTFVHFSLSEDQQNVLNSFFLNYQILQAKPESEKDLLLLTKLILSPILSFYYNNFFQKSNYIPSLLEELKTKLSCCAYLSMDLNEALSHFYYTQSYLCRFFKKHTGMNMTDYINNIKLKRAKSLLSYTDFSVTKICTLLGFSSESYFFKLYKKKYGLTPLQQRKTSKNALPPPPSYD